MRVKSPGDHTVAQNRHPSSSKRPGSPSTSPQTGFVPFRAVYPVLRPIYWSKIAVLAICNEGRCFSMAIWLSDDSKWVFHMACTMPLCHMVVHFEVKMKPFLSLVSGPWRHISKVSGLSSMVIQRKSRTQLRPRASLDYQARFTLSRF